MYCDVKKKYNKETTEMKRTIVIVATLMVCAFGYGQDKELMNGYQTRLQALFDRVQNAPTDNERYLANEEAVQVLGEALAEEGSENWKWNFTKYVSVLRSPDKVFTIITWPVVRDNGEYECFGFVQSKGKDEDDEEELKVYELHDHSEEIINREEMTLDADNWLGAVYQEIIQTSYEGKTFYTLLGWNGCSMLTQRKVIEPIQINARNGKPQFGQALFKKEKNKRRVILEYNKEAMVYLGYEQQLSVSKENVRVKKDGRMVMSQVSHEQKEQMIIFDEIEPQVEGMEGLYQYYVPSGKEMAYVFVNGKWELRPDAQGRLTDKKLNKEFKPIEKKKPAYQTINTDNNN